MNNERSIMRIDPVQQAILLIRGQRVMLDADLTNLYHVATKRLNEQVKRNADRFPSDFMFQLTLGVCPSNNFLEVGILCKSKRDSLRMWEKHSVANVISPSNGESTHSKIENLNTQTDS